MPHNPSQPLGSRDAHQSRGLGLCHPLQVEGRDPGLGVALTSLATASRSVTPRLKSRMSAPGRGSSTASMSVSSVEVAALSMLERRQAAGQGQGRARPACTWSSPHFNCGVGSDAYSGSPLPSYHPPSSSGEKQVQRDTAALPAAAQEEACSQKTPPAPAHQTWANGSQKP